MARVCAFIRFMPTSSNGTARRTWWLNEDDEGISDLQTTYNYWWGLRDDGPGVLVDNGQGVAQLGISMKYPSGIQWTTGSFSKNYNDAGFNQNPDGGGDNINSSSYYHETMEYFQGSQEERTAGIGSNVLPIFLDSDQGNGTDLSAGVFILTSSLNPYGEPGSRPDGYFQDKLLRIYHTVDTDSENNITYYNDITDQCNWATRNIPEYYGAIINTSSGLSPLDNLINMLWQGDTAKAPGGYTASQAGIYMTASEGAIPAWYYDQNKEGPGSQHECQYTASFVKLATLQNYA
jgi:hypothetical protein